MLRKTICYMALLLSAGLCALPADSLVHLRDLQFNSQAEKELFYSAARGKADVIDLLLMPYNGGAGFSSASAHAQIDDCVAGLEKATAGQADAKRVKQVYREVHKRFLKVYRLNNSFGNIFENGEYNCLSASALYAIIFKRLRIPFQIIEEPQHVYLVAYPQSERIFIETTSPENGYLKLSDSQVADFTKHLYSSKLITREEYEQSSSNALFNKYYYSASGLDLDKMPGVQYFNYSAYHLEDKNYEKATAEIKKACFLEPSERNKYLLKSILIHQISNSDYADGRQVDNLILLCGFNNLKDKDVSNENLQQEFGRVMNDQLIRNSNAVLFDTSYARIYRSLNDSALKSNIAFDYHYELGRQGLLFVKSMDYELPHLRAAYKINPKHSNLQSIILAYFGKMIDKTSDPSSILKTIAVFSNEFDFLNSHSLYLSVKANCFLELAYRSLIADDVKKGESYISNFETLAASQKVEPDERFVEKAYSQAASYYYKKGNTPRTRQLLSTGIKYAPESFGLRMRLSQVH